MFKKNYEINQIEHILSYYEIKVKIRNNYFSELTESASIVCSYSFPTFENDHSSRF